MDMRMTREAGKLTVFLSGRLDTNTTPQMEAQLENKLRDYEGTDVSLN